MAIIKFVREDQLAKELKALAEPSTGVAIAAPFWGSGATRRLGLSKRRRLRVVCTFDALACNPSELAELDDIGVEIRSNARLHAKIYAAGKFVLVGSSNPSQYGLTQEGDTISGSIEGNVLTDDVATVADATRTIEDLWEHPDTIKITRKMIDDEIERRAGLPRPFTRRALKSKTLLAAFKEAPELFDSVYVAAYWNSLDPGGKAELRRLQVQAAASGADPKSAVFRKAWGYQFEAAPPAGAWLVALDCKHSEPKVWGASQVPTPVVAMAVPDEYDLYPTIRGVITVPGATQNLRISAEEKAKFVTIARKLQRKAELVPLADAVALMNKRT